MRDLPELKKRLQQEIMDSNIQAVADKLKLHYNTVRKVANGQQPNPRYNTMVAIDRGLFGDEK